MFVVVSCIVLVCVCKSWCRWVRLYLVVCVMNCVRWMGMLICGCCIVSGVMKWLCRCICLVMFSGFLLRCFGKCWW